MNTDTAINSTELCHQCMEVATELALVLILKVLQMEQISLHLSCHFRVDDGDFAASPTCWSVRNFWKAVSGHSKPFLKNCHDQQMA